MTLIISGAPRTKKNSQQIVQAGGRPRVIQSAQHRAWESRAVLELRQQWHPREPLRVPVRLTATVYRERAVGDLLNYLAAVSDALERARVVDDDRLILSLDGSRLAKDAARPRVELTLTPMEAP